MQQYTKKIASGFRCLCLFVLAGGLAWDAQAQDSRAPDVIPAPAPTAEADVPSLVPTAEAEVPSLVPTAEAEVPFLVQKRDMRAFLNDRLEVGIRFDHFSLHTNKDEEGLIGSIDELHEEQDHTPYLFAIWNFSPYFAAELTWARAEAVTWTSSEAYTDGSVLIRGPVLTLLGRYPFRFTVKKRTFALTPYGGFGLAHMSAQFNHAGWWHHGFGGATWQDAELRYQEWRDEGAPEWPNSGYRRTMSVDDQTAFVLAGGCSARLTDHMSLDLYVRYMNIKIDNTYTLSRYGNVFQTRYSTWDMSNTALGLGVKYCF